jgi:hypothetical protein
MKNLPKRVTTVTKKLKTSNPWGLGDRISEAFEANWDTAERDISKLYKEQWVIDFCEKVNLSPRFFIKNLVGIAL